MSGQPAATVGQLTQSLNAWRQGDTQARQILDREIYSALKGLARQRLAGSGPATLNPTALVNEALLRLLGGSCDWTSRAHFIALAALQMRAVLVDHFRRHSAQKRGSDALTVVLDEESIPAVADHEFLDLHRALEALAGHDQRTARVVELTYFGGLNASEVAAVMAISDATVERDLAFGRTWLKRELRA